MERASCCNFFPEHICIEELICNQPFLKKKLEQGIEHFDNEVLNYLYIPDIYKNSHEVIPYALLLVSIYSGCKLEIIGDKIVDPCNGTFYNFMGVGDQKFIARVNLSYFENVIKFIPIKQ